MKSAKRKKDKQLRNSCQWYAGQMLLQNLGGERFIRPWCSKYNDVCNPEKNECKKEDKRKMKIGETVEDNETLEDIVADIRMQNQGLREDANALSPLVCDLLHLADRIEAAAKRTYAAVDYAVANIEDASSSEITFVRRALEKTIGDYYE